MVRIPSFTRRPGTAGTPVEDRGHDGDGAGRGRTGGETAAETRATPVREQIDDRGTHRATGTATVTDQTRSDQAVTGQTTTGQTTTGQTSGNPTVTDRVGADGTGVDRAVPERGTGRVVERVPAPKARASMLATLGLIFGVTAALLVLSGVLAGYGILLAIVGLLLSIGGVSATSRRHIAGRTDALLGIALCVGAIVLGGLALTGTLPWLTSEVDKATEIREWLDTQFTDRF